MEDPKVSVCTLATMVSVNECKSSVQRGDGCADVEASQRRAVEVVTVLETVRGHQRG